ncbi:MAG: YciI family protein [Deltaproteobacteria bacterium]|nr:YciI family protein [Deltaproteobacteria bacterium]
MLYSILIYDNEAVVDRHTEEQTRQQLGKHQALQDDLRRSGTLGPVARLMPSTAAVTVRKGDAKPLVTDGPFAETKEQLVGFYLFDCCCLEEAIEKAAMLPLGSCSLEIRPVTWFDPGVR